jgi:hypothetical protein
VLIMQVEQRLADPSVQVPALALAQRVVEVLLEQHVPEA